MRPSQRKLHGTGSSENRTDRERDLLHRREAEGELQPRLRVQLGPAEPRQVRPREVEAAKTGLPSKCVDHRSSVASRWWLVAYV